MTNKLSVCQYYQMLQDNNQTSRRVVYLQNAVKESMKLPKTSWNEVASIITKGTVAEPLVIRRALAITEKFNKVPLALWPGQLLAGSYCLPDNRIMTGDLPTYATKDELTKTAEYNFGVRSIVGHIVPHYPKLLHFGLKGIRKQAQNQLAKTKEKDKQDFYHAVVIVLDAVNDLANRYANYCQIEAEACQDKSRRQELLTLADNLYYSPYNPPQTFQQALNSVWLLHLALQLTGNNLAMGRIDQYLFPYLLNDLDTNKLSIEQAQELMDCFLLKFNERSIANQVAEAKTDKEQSQATNSEKWAKRNPFAHSTQRFNVRDSLDATNHWLQNIIVGGVAPTDGCDATNLATIMALESFRRNQLTNPNITVRLHREAPDYLWEMTADTLKSGGGQPTLFNDEVIIPSLVASGISKADARDYANDGCWEVIVPGRNDFYFDRFNILKCLEWVLNHGKSLVDGKQEAPDLGKPEQFVSYEQLNVAWQQMLRYEIKGLMDRVNNEFGKRALIAPTPLLSSLLEGPIEKGKDLTAGGAKYITYGLIAEGFSHLIDSFVALKQVVYDNKEVAFSEVVQAIANDFIGYEELQNKLQSAAKYGNNDPQADEIASQLISQFTNIVSELNENYPQINFITGIGTFSWFIAIGEGVGATPDGRHKSQAVASNFSPSAGTAKKGALGALLSHSKLQLQNLTVGSPLDLGVSQQWVAGKEGRERLIGLLKSFVNLGGNMLTLTIADVEALKKAQQNPEDYQHLRVRMGGWSAYFTMLSQEQQDHHIAKQQG